MAVGDKEALGQGLGIDGLQEALERHALAVHPAHPHIHLYPPLLAYLALLLRHSLANHCCFQRQLFQVMHTCPEATIQYR